ncbi:DNA replication and repair protein RecO [Synechococcus sp. PCC 7502]|uniref:DNA repair protein RecO n=1 Tax=Synechococcus sp. PCC 7502 TaxID=1173263 RepID=UPI00029FBC8C|nr:DNA repair protein RecO [Synechococcus sp. PCC 7502]AFY74357.1 DNA replication and repair protein RecO [Synechococcus sp. PCC 7502]
MGQTYRATGINLKSMALGESDRLLTILTKEYGLIKAVATGARKHRSGMAGRSGLFVMNDLQISSGRNLDRITQAETIYAFTGLGQNLGKLTAAQYLAELVLVQALSAQPQEQLFGLLTQQLKNLEGGEHNPLLSLNHGIYHLLAIAGFAPELHACCLTRQPLTPNLSSSQWQVGFSIAGGGVVKLAESLEFKQSAPKINYHLNGRELNALQTLTAYDPPFDRSPDQFLDRSIEDALSYSTWITVERILRAYAQYHFDRPILSGTLIDTCFNL